MTDSSRAIVEVAESAQPPTDFAAVDPASQAQVRTLLATIFFIAACGLIYELLIATVSSYHLGSSVTQFSIAIGVFIGAMGLGSALSQQIRNNLLGTFILIEISLGLLGGVSVALLYTAYTGGLILYWISLVSVLVGIGSLTGLELPLLTRILRNYGSLRAAIAQALSFDYIGALAGSLLFPLVLLPSFGMMRTACLIGLVNVGVAVWNIRIFSDRLARPRQLLLIALTIGLLLLLGFLGSFELVSLLESQLYEDEIIYVSQTPFQRIIMTRWRDDFRLYLDGNLQFSSLDEYRYHEALVHPAMHLAAQRREVLILGGGDGLGLRELEKYPDVQRITLVDIDPKMTELGANYPPLVRLNQNAFADPRVRVVHADAFRFFQDDTERYDVIIADLPDPNHELLAKLYTTRFYRLMRRRLVANGIFVTQATSPYTAREAFWCIDATLKAVGLHTAPYHTHVPTFGEWGFILSGQQPLGSVENIRLTVKTRYLTDALIPGCFVWSKDCAEVPVTVSTLDRPVILQYYQDSWRQWMQ